MRQEALIKEKMDGQLRKLDGEGKAKDMLTFIFDQRRLFNVLLREVIADILNRSQVVQTEVLVPKNRMLDRLDAKNQQKNFLDSAHLNTTFSLPTYVVPAVKSVGGKTTRGCLVFHEYDGCCVAGG